MDPDSPATEPISHPSLIAYILGFLLVGLSWGFTTPFIRRAAVSYNPPPRPWLDIPETTPAYAPLAIKLRIKKAAYTVLDLLKSPKYAIPLVVNLTGSVWFFLLVGKAELSLTVPITNSLAFLFTVVGEWMAEGKVISRGQCACCGEMRWNLDCENDADCVLGIRYVDWYDSGVDGHWALRAFEDVLEWFGVIKETEIIERVMELDRITISYTRL